MNKKKKKKQHNQVTIAYITAGVIIACIMALIGISAFMRVNNILVEGIYVYTPEKVAEASGISKGDNLLYLRSGDIINNIKTQLPYINTVEVTRKLPDTLIIQVSESTAIAYLPFAGDALIIDSTGRVLDIQKINIGTPVAAGGVNLIEIRGISVNDVTPGRIPDIGQGSEMSFRAMQDLLAVMELEGVAVRVNYLDVASITNISFGYNDMYRILIGSTRDFRHKISGLPSAVTMIQERYPNARGTYNMTDPSGEYRFQPE